MQELKTKNQWFLLYLKGVAMGAADVVPGVSGGTIAFITGIYEQLICSISSFTPKLFSICYQKGIRAGWQEVNGTFLIVLLAGIGSSVLSLAKLIHYFLENHPIPVWAFFLGLIIASGIIVASHIQVWNAKTVFGLLGGCAFAMWLMGLVPAGPLIDPDGAIWFVFLSGSLAFCAMILPGISGSFILLLLGMYQYILGLLLEGRVGMLLIFVAGGGVGLIAFAKLLRVLLDRFHNVMLAVLTGFIIGALTKAWPWKETLSYRENRHGEMVPYAQENVLPWVYQQTTGLDAKLGLAMLLLIIGACLPLVIQRFDKR